MPSTGTPRSKTPRSQRGAPGSRTLLGPPDSTMPAGLAAEPSSISDGAWEDLAVDAEFPQTARDQLRVLRAEVEDDDGLVGHVAAACRGCEDARSRTTAAERARGTTLLYRRDPTRRGQHLGQRPRSTLSLWGSFALACSCCAHAVPRAAGAAPPQKAAANAAHVPDGTARRWCPSTLCPQVGRPPTARASTSRCAHRASSPCRS